MATLLRRWWTSLGHGVHSPTVFRLITLVLDPVSYTHLDVYKRQVYLYISAVRPSVQDPNLLLSYRLLCCGQFPVVSATRSAPSEEA